MQDRFTGDIADFAKFGLLNRLAGRGRDRAFRLGVVWYHAPDAGDGAGRRTDYLAEPLPNPYAAADRRLFLRLGRILAVRGRRVEYLETGGVLPGGTACYGRPLCCGEIPPWRVEDRLAYRRAWLHGALRSTARCGLVFLDPDNGLAAGAPRHTRRGLRYAYPDEVRAFVGRGQAVVLIQFLQRDGPHAAQIGSRLRQLAGELPGGAPRPFALWWRHRVSLAFLVLPATEAQAGVLLGRARAMLGTPWKRFFAPPVTEGTEGGTSSAR